MVCPDENRLVEYVEGVLADDRVHAIERHVDGCASCRRTLAAFALGSQRSDDGAGDAVSSGGERYVIHEVLGTGAMSIVYAATDLVLDRKVALKVLRDPEPGKAARLQREAQAMARLAHPNVLPVHDVGVADGRMFLTAELVAGRTLDGWLAAAPRSWRAIVDVLVQAGRGLAAAHAAGIAHRDFKPSNVLVGDDGRVRVADFGLARRDPIAGEERADLARSSGALVGTPLYMAPEQLAGATADARSDQFSFCVALYEALYGARPFAATDLAGLRRAIEVGPTPPRRAGVPGGVRRIVLRGLAVDPGRRYPSMDALCGALVRCQGQRRRRALVAAVVTAAVATGAAVHATRGPAPSCAVPTWGEGWDDARRTEIANAFAATRSPAAAEAARGVIARIDRWVAAWSRTYLEVCEATELRRERSARLRDLAMACLAERRAQLGALTDVYATADAAVVERALLAVDQLGDPAGCGDTRRLAEAPDLPHDPSARERLAGLRAELARGKALRIAGKYAEAIDVLAARAAAVKAAGYRPLEAAFGVELGIVYAQTFDAKRAEATLLEALAAAQAAGDTAVTATAATQLAHVMGNHSQQFAEARRWTALAAGAIERLGDDRALAADLAMVRGALALSEGDADEARAQYQRAVELRGQLAGAEDPSVGVAHHGVGLGELRGGDAATALRELDRALAILEPALGRQHPKVADLQVNRSRALSELGRFAEAEVVIRQALAIQERLLGRDNPRIAATLLDLAANLQWQGRFAEALGGAERARAIYDKAGSESDASLALTSEGLAYAELGKLGDARDRLARALAIQERILGPDHLDLAVTLGALAAAKLRDRDPRGAIADDLRAVSIIERASGRDSRVLLDPLLGLVEAYLAVRERDRAIKAAERAHAIATRHADDAPAIARAAFALARLLGSGERALGLARDARERFARLGAPQLAEVEAWLARRQPAVGGRRR